MPEAPNLTQPSNQPSNRMSGEEGIRQRFAKFYESYPLEIWGHKLQMLKKLLESPSVLGQQLATTLNEEGFEYQERVFSTMLKTDAHFTYMQMVETLFELIFALEHKDDDLLWLALSQAQRTFKDNYKRVSDIANRQLGFLEVKVPISAERSVSRAEYIFFLTAGESQSTEEMAKNLEVIRGALRVFAEDFVDRGDYNAYKHALRLYHSPAHVSFTPQNSKIPGLSLSAEDSFFFLELETDQAGRQIVYERVKAFDADRDLRMAWLCYRMMSNIIGIRRAYFKCQADKASVTVKVQSFVDVNLHQLSIPKGNLVNYRFSIAESKPRNMKPKPPMQKSL